MNPIARNGPYRPDIDGLRAIAVLAVIAYHAFAEALPGGFLGVDIFFVISGYLISRNVLAEYENGRFLFSRFYAHRIRRLFPAMIAVLFTSLMLGWAYLLPAEFELLGKHVVAAFAYVPNLVLLQETADYFDPASDLKPLLHLWSLGIEEQFYLLWPLTLIAALRARFSGVCTLAIFALGSLALFLATAIRFPAWSFYFPLLRAWELVAGGLLAWWEWAKPVAARKVLARKRPAVAWVGFSTLVSSLLWIGNENRFFRGGAILPVIGTTLLIAAVPQGGFLSKLLSQRVLVFVGLISYPLYLWHWAILSFLRIVKGSHPGHGATTGALVLGFALAVVTYIAIEKPIRLSRNNPVPLLLGTFGLIGLLGLAIWTQVLPPYSARLPVGEIQSAIDDWVWPPPRWNPLDPGGVFYSLPNRGAGSEVLFFGDSNMQQYWPRIDEISEQSRKPAVFATIAGCAPIPGVLADGTTKCDRFFESVSQYIAQHPVGTVVIGAHWDTIFTKASLHTLYQNGGSEELVLGTPGYGKALLALEQLLGSLKRHGKSTYLILNLPSAKKANPLSLLSRDLFHGIRLQSTHGYPLEDYLAKYGAIRTDLMQISKKTNAQVLDPLEVLCDASWCKNTTDNDKPIYKNGGHLRNGFTRTHATFMDTVVQ